MVKITIQTSTNIVRTSARIRVYPVDVVLHMDRFLPSAVAIKTSSAGTRQRVHAGAGPCELALAWTWYRRIDVGRRMDTRHVAMGLHRRGAASARTRF